MVHGMFDSIPDSTLPPRPAFAPAGCLFLLSTVQLTATFPAAGSPAAFGWLILITSLLLRMPSISIPGGDDAPLDGRASYPIRPFPREIKGASELMLVP